MEQTEILQKLYGTVERITYRNQENGWSVLKVLSVEHKNIIPVTVHQLDIVAGETLEFYGEWVNHPKFGEQFKATKTISKKPATLNALEKYLGSGLIKGIGPKTAKLIVNYFKEQTLDIFDKDIKRLMELQGIAHKKLKMITTAWEEHKSIKDIMMFLQSNDISTLFAIKIFKQYNHDAIGIVTENPYRLAKDIYGIGFFSADKIAKKIGFADDSFQRISAGIKHVLSSSRELGHCYLTREQLYGQTKELLELDDEQKIDTPLQELISKKEISTRQMTPDAEIFYYAKSLFFDEINLAKKIKMLQGHIINVDAERVRKWVTAYCQKTSFVLSDEQTAAVLNLTQHPVSILTGGPGCGKTTITKVLVKLFQAMNKSVVLAAPTGRAAQRMMEVIGVESKTIHRLLSWNPSVGRFDKNDDNPLLADVIIIDETSMIDISLAASLFAAIKVGSQVIVVGDSDQLPAVGAGNVLKDMILSSKIPHSRLTKIFRQAEQSLIVTSAHKINNGEYPEIKSPIADGNLWGSSVNCLFIDSEEITQEQLSFVSKVKKHIQEDEIKSVDQGEDTGKDYFNIPQKFLHVDIEKLLQSKTTAQELAALMRKIPTHSTLRYDMTATQTILRLITKTLPKHYGTQEMQLLTPMTRGSLGTENLNKRIQEAINPYNEAKGQILFGQRAFRPGDRVIQKVNNYDLNVFNGDIGYINEVNSEDSTMSVSFGKGKNQQDVSYDKSDLVELAHAYAITIHKSQGSEFPIVIIPVTTQHFKMLFRNLIYTGLTRAKKLCVFVGSRKALVMAIKNTDMIKRQTTLKELL